MLIRSLKSNSAVFFILIPLFVMLVWIRSFLEPGIFSFFEGENHMPLYALFTRLLPSSILAHNLVASGLLVLLSFMILRLNAVYNFIKIRTFMPSVIFVLIVSGLISLHTLHPVYPGTLFLLLCIDRIFSAYENNRALVQSFDSGFFLSAGALFYLPLLAFVPVIWIGFLLLRRSSEWRDFVLSLIGLALPWLFVFIWYFLHDQTGMLRCIILQNLNTSNSLSRESLSVRIYLAFLCALTLWSSVHLLGQYDAKNISSRKYFQLFFLIFLIALLQLFLIPSVSREILVVMAVPLTFLISNYLIEMKSRFWGNLLILLLTGLVIYLQFV
ncbi:MAG: DUF6427 family protein [Mangrovibacterium sp.]